MHQVQGVVDDFTPSKKKYTECNSKGTLNKTNMSDFYASL